MQQVVNLPSGYAFFPSAFRMGDRYFPPGYYRVPEGNSFLPGEFYAPNENSSGYVLPPEMFGNQPEFHGLPGFAPSPPGHALPDPSIPLPPEPTIELPAVPSVPDGLGDGSPESSTGGVSTPEITSGPRLVIAPPSSIDMTGAGPAVTIGGAIKSISEAALTHGTKVSTAAGALNAAGWLGISVAMGAARGGTVGALSDLAFSALQNVVILAMLGVGLKVGIAAIVIVAGVEIVAGDKLRAGFQELLEGIGEWSGEYLNELVNVEFQNGQSWRPRRRNSPIALDLDNDGLETTAESGWSGPLFDHNGDGLKQATGWLSADDALLVLDRNGNGLIDNGQELFGDSTPLQGGGTAEHGYTALAELDGNGDGVVDASDAQFADLRLWRDLNQDGISQANELSTLDELGVASIDTAFTTTNILNNGNRIPYISHFTRADDSTGTTGDIYFAISKFHTEFAAQAEPTALTRNLPDFHGSGQVRNLRDAATRSPALANLLQTYASTDSRQGQLALLDELLVAWAGNSPMPSMARRAFEAGYVVNFRFGNLGENSTDLNTLVAGIDSPADLQGLFDDYHANQSAAYKDWIAKLAVLERFNGEEFFDFDRLAKPPKTLVASVSASPTPIEVSLGKLTLSFAQPRINLLQQSYDALRESVYRSLLFQTRLAPYLDELALTVNDGTLALDFAGVETTFQNAFSDDAVNTAVDLIELNRYRGADFKSAGWDPMALFSQTFAVPLAQLGLTDELAEFGIRFDADGTLQLEVNDATRRYLGETVFGSPGSDSIETDHKASIVMAGAGDDVLTSGNGDDTLFGDTGNDTIDAGSGDDTVDGGSGDDVLTGGSGNDQLYGGTGNDVLTVHARGDNHLFGGDGDDVLGVDLSGYYANGAGNHTNRFEGGRGNDRMTGNLSADTYVFNRGDGQDVIVDNDYGPYRRYRYSTRYTSSGNTDRILFGEGIGQGDLVLHRDGGALVIALYADGAQTADRITVENWFVGATHRIEQFTFADGSTMDLDAIHTSWLATVQTASDDVLDTSTLGAVSLAMLGGADQVVTGAGADVIDAGAGDDHVDAGDGDDHILGGEGHDQLVGGAGNDHIEGGAGDDVLSGGHGNDMLFGDAGNDTIDAGSGDDTVDGGSGDDVLTGGSGNDQLYGGTGNDVLTVHARGDNHLFGGDGDDVLGVDLSGYYANGAGNHTNRFEGGRGNDRMTGNLSADTYVFNRGDGQDVIVDNDYGPYRRYRYSTRYTSSGNTDRILFGEGIGQGDLVLHRDGGALVIALYADGAQTADRITVENWFVGATHRIEQFAFADGSTMNPQTLIDQGMRIHGTDGADTLTGTPGDDLVDGGLGNDLLTGSDGDDRYRFSAGSGQDQLDIQGTAGDDVVSYGEGVAADELWFSRSGDDLLVSVLESNDSLSIKNWYGDDESTQPARFEVDTGEVLMRNQVEQLINAVAAFAPPVAGALNLDPDQQTQYQQIIATHWRPDS